MSAETPSTSAPEPTPEAEAAATAAPAKSTRPSKAVSVKAEIPAVPKFNFEALFAMQQSQLDTFVAAQKIMFDLVTDFGSKQQARMKDTAAKAEAMIKGFGTNKEPTAYVSEAKAVFEEVMSDARETMDLGLKAQNEMIDLLAKRAAASVGAAKSLSA